LKFFNKKELPPGKGGGRKTVFLKKAENVVFSRDGVASVTPFPLSSIHPEG
jgi:hypothetical protein